LYPESAEGSTIILDAFEKILSAFLKLPWADDRSHSVGVEIGLPYVADLSKIVWRLKSRTIEPVRSHAKTRYSGFDFPAHAFFRWLSSDDSLYREALALPEGKEILKPLQESLGDAPIQNCWRVSNFRLTFEFATARQTEQLLRDRFPSGAPEVSDGKRNGRGTETYSDGREYVGEWRDGKGNGQGTLSWPNGLKYVGEFKDELQSGQGTLTWPNGQKYVGEFKNDKPNGQGKYSFPGGAKYVGEIKDGLYNGQGTYTSAEGWTQSGNWKSGKFVGG
jgi:hypothetical protein